MMVGCVERVSINDAVSQAKQEPEYAVGLAEIMELSPTVYASNILTTFYNVGYLSGKGDCDNGSPRGPYFGKGLALANKKGAETGDSIIVLLVTTTFQRGYQQGYKHQQNELASHAMTCGWHRGQ